MTRGIRAIDLPSTRAAYYAPATVTSQPLSSWIHVSGQPGSLVHVEVPSDYESQIHLALLNLHKVLVAAGASIADIARLTLYIVNYDSQQRKHTRHIQRFLRSHRPAITLVPVSQLAGSGMAV